jgi:hypothetical protein
LGLPIEENLAHLSLVREITYVPALRAKNLRRNLAGPCQISGRTSDFYGQIKMRLPWEDNALTTDIEANMVD